MDSDRTGAMKLLGVLVAAGVSAACAGGQTGDNGTDGGGCSGEIQSRKLTLEQAEAAGFAVSDFMTVLKAGREEPGQRVVLTLPPSLWQERDLEPPADRSARGAVIIGPATTFVEFSSEPPASCSDSSPFARLDVTFDYTVRVEELELEWTRPGFFSVFVDGEPFADGVPVMANLESLFEEDTSTCTFEIPADAAVEGLRMRCQQIDARPECVEPAELVDSPPLPGTDLTLSEVIALTNARSPMALACCDGSEISAAFQLRAPDQYCPMAFSPRSVPATLAIGAERFELDGDAWQAAGLQVSDEIRCEEAVDADGVCEHFTSESAYDSLERCQGLEVRLPPWDAETEYTTVSLWSDAESNLQLRVSLGSSGNANGPYPRCIGQVQLR